MKKSISVFFVLSYLFSCTIIKKAECIDQTNYEGIAIEYVMNNYKEFSMELFDESNVFVKIDSVPKITFPLSRIYEHFYTPHYQNTEKVLGEIAIIKQSEQNIEKINLPCLCSKYLKKIQIKQTFNKNIATLSFSKAYSYQNFSYIELQVKRNFSYGITYIVLKIDTKSKSIKKMNFYNAIR